MRRRRIILALVAISAAILAVAIIARNREPRFDGRTLSDWLSTTLSRNQLLGNSPTQEETVRAVTAIGTNAIPYLLNWLQAKRESPTKVRLVLLIKRLFPQFHYQWQFDRVSMALMGFEILGTSGQHATPSLIGIAASGDSQTRYHALVCLKLVKAEKDSFLPVLARGLTDSDEGVRYLAARILHSRFPDNARDLWVYETYPRLLVSETNRTAFE